MSFKFQTRNSGSRATSRDNPRSRNLDDFLALEMCFKVRASNVLFHKWKDRFPPGGFVLLLFIIYWIFDLLFDVFWHLSTKKSSLSIRYFCKFIWRVFDRFTKARGISPFGAISDLLLCGFSTSWHSANENYHFVRIGDERLCTNIFDIVL